jgi:AGCS family alanine or glycine:cation symporter
MLSTYTAGFVAFISGCVALLTKTWQDPDLPIGISMVAASFQQYFSVFGIVIVVICTSLFGFGTILGNCYNGSQCFTYLTNNKKTLVYFIMTTAMIIVGALMETTICWSVIDLVLVGVAVPHLGALLLHASRENSYKVKPSLAKEGSF